MLIAHLSDLHFRPRGALFQDLVDPAAMFAAALDRLEQLSPAPDLVIITGDLVEEGSEAEYDEVRQALARIRQPLIVIPGNHDDREGFRACFPAHDWMPTRGPFNFVAPEFGPLRIVAIDVTVPGQHHGVFDDDTAGWLRATLAAERGRPTLLLMHQPPFVSGMGFIDPYRCFEGERLAEILRDFPNVERVLCGHIHRAMHLRFGGTLLTTCPSTALALDLRLAEGAPPMALVEPPAFLVHHWRPEVGLITHHVPVGGPGVSFGT